MKRFSCHATSLSRVALLIVLAFPVPARGVRAQQANFRSEFTVLSRGQVVGTESVTVTQSADGWLISSIGSLGAPFNLTTTKFQLRYTPDWQPLSLGVEGMLANQLLTINSAFTSTEARNETVERGQRTTATHPISPQAIVLPSGFYAPYEALAARLGSATVGATFRLYVAPQGETGATLTRITTHRLVSPTGPIELRQFDLTFPNLRAPLAVEIWTDSNNRLARLSIPAAWLIVIRDDISSVMTREETITRPGDEEVFVPALGFKLSGTISKASSPAGRGPARRIAMNASRASRFSASSRAHWPIRDSSSSGTTIGAWAGAGGASRAPRSKITPMTRSAWSRGSRDAQMSIRPGWRSPAMPKAVRSHWSPAAARNGSAVSVSSRRPARPAAS
jgi:hypothetical protein